MKIIKERQPINNISYERSFVYKDDEQAGFGFPCNKDGIVEKMNPQAQVNYEACLKGQVDGQEVIDRGIKEYQNSYTEPAVGKCDVCGKEVVLEGFTNTCVCGADYNSFGQRLADRSQWGEETGETAADILSSTPEED